MLSTKTRLGIFLTYVITASITIFIIIAPALIDFGFNEQDPLYFDGEQSSTYQYHNTEEEIDLDIEVTNVGSESSECTFKFGDEEQDAEFTHDGYYIDPTYGETKNQSIFWVHIVEEERSEGKDYTGETYHIYDPIGILGPKNTEYIIEITEADAYWTDEAPVHGAQFSLVFDIKDTEGKRVGIGEMDKTCGKVFQIEKGGRSLKLTNTNYEISRNRLAAIIPMFVLIGLMSVGTFVYFYLFRMKKRGEEVSSEKLIDTIFLVGLGGAVFAIDIFSDVWMYAIFGFLGNIILHGAVLIGGLIFSLLRGYKLKWLIPGLLEIAFLLPMYGYIGEPYAPHITAFMGLTMSFLVLLWLTGYPRQKSQSKLGKIISQAI